MEGEHMDMDINIATMRADLHVHSTVSDGSFTRQEIVKLAKKKGLSAIAFSDHDCTVDFDKVGELGRENGIKIIPAIEISAYDFESKKKVHVLGYGYTDPRPLEQLCSPTLEKRNANCLKQIEILSQLGYDITPEKVKKYSDTCIYKQHILKYLFDTKQSEEIFGRVYKEIFKNGGKCDFDIVYADCRDAVKAIKEAGGYAVLAHPGQQENFSTVKKLCDCGLDGIELFHPSNDEKAHTIIKELCAEHGLFFTGGSDFHGLYERGGKDLGDFTSPENPLLKN